MRIIELDIAQIFEDVSRDELIKNVKKKQEQEFKNHVLKKMHRLVQKQGDRQSIGGYAFEISKYLGGAISPKELEQMYRKEYMNESQVNEWGRIVKGVNTTVDVGTDEIKRQAAKFGNTVDKDGRPPTLSKKVKGSSTNVLNNLGLTEMQIACIEGGHSLEDLEKSAKKQSGDIFRSLMEADGNIEITPQILKKLEVYVDRLFSSLGIDVEFTRHFLDRVNDPRNIKPITVQELANLFKKTYSKWGKKIARLGPDAQAVIKDMSTDINMPFVLNWDQRNQELDLVAKTIMRKKNFTTPNQEFPVENFADGKVKGKSRPGRVKRAGASCNGSVTDLRKRAKNSSGEKAKMYHWCANMKSGRKKK